MGYVGLWVATGMGYDRFDCTRKVLLSRQNPYFAQGKTFFGIGCVSIASLAISIIEYIPSGPHVDAWNPW